jgi:hypothetical protein
LEEMESAVLIDAFDGPDGTPPDVADEGLARAGGFTIDEDRAGTALAFPTAVLGAGEVEVLAQDAQQAPLGISVDRVPRSVHDELFDRRHRCPEPNVEGRTGSNGAWLHGRVVRLRRQRHVRLLSTMSVGDGDARRLRRRVRPRHVRARPPGLDEGVLLAYCIRCYGITY